MAKYASGKTPTTAGESVHQGLFGQEVLPAVSGKQLEVVIAEGSSCKNTCMP
jgi:hypothetical protein